MFERHTTRCRVRQKPYNKYHILPLALLYHCRFTLMLHAAPLYVSFAPEISVPHQRNLAPFYTSQWGKFGGVSRAIPSPPTQFLPGLLECHYPFNKMGQGAAVQ